MRLVHLAADIFDTICGPSIIHPAAHYRKIVQNVVQCLTSNSYNPEGESYATGSSGVEGIFTSLLDGGFDWTVCGCPELFMSDISTDPTYDQQSEMLPLSRISPRAAADSRVSPYPMGRTSHKHRFCISLLTLHNGQALGHSSRSAPFRPFLLHSIYVLLSIAFVYFPCSLFATLVPSSPASQIPRSLHSTHCIALPVLIIAVVIVIKLPPLSRGILHTLAMFSLVPPSETHCVFKFRCISYAPLSPFCVWFLRCICIRVVSC